MTTSAIITYLKKSKDQIQRVALHLDNSEFWLDLDKCLTQLEKVIIPVASFFTHQQIQYMLKMTSFDTIICHINFSMFWQSKGFETCIHTEYLVLLKRTVTNYSVLPNGTHKITFTSGTTSEPKGVCLSLEHINKVALSLAQITKHFGVKKHMSVLPMSVLLENMASHYSAQEMQVEIISPSLVDIGWQGSSQIDIGKLIKTIQKYKPDSLILMPQMLKMLILALQQQPVDLRFLKFVAVGGANCSKNIISKAHQLNLPVYEGYGISECASVISLNTEMNHHGSVGKVLGHQQITLAEDGEILVKGQLFLGYVGEEEFNEEWFHTGDLGRIENGYLKILGRKKNVIINSFGRNISPDWIEAEILAIPSILQVAIYGESQEYLTAICVSKESPSVLLKAVNKINLSLPDYARIKDIIVSSQFFTYENDMATSSGKLKHQHIFNHYKHQLKENYANTINT